jgi:hypothetical protein
VTWGNPTSISIKNNKFTGSVSVLRDVEYVATDPQTTTINMRQDIGSQYGLYVEGLEDGDIEGNIFTGMSEDGILFATKVSAPTGAVRIRGNFFDGAGNIDLAFIPLTGASMRNVNVVGNSFNGEEVGLHAIYVAAAAGVRTTSELTVTGNSFIAYLKTPILLNGATHTMISGNAVTSYNARNLSVTDPVYVAAIYASAQTAQTYIVGNVVGGNGPYTYQHIVIAGGLTNVVASTNLTTV